MVTGVDVALAARRAGELVDAGRPPAALVDMVTAAGFGPHDRWPNQIVRVVLAGLVDSPPAPADAKTWAADAAERAAAVDGDDIAAVLRWALGVGDPATAAVKRQKAGSVEDGLRAARLELATQVTSGTVAAVVDAAKRAAEHHKASKAAYADEDAERLARWADDDIAVDVQGEEQRMVDERRAQARLEAMWGAR